MILAEALEALALRMSEVLHHSVGIGPDVVEEVPRLVVLIDAMTPIPDVGRGGGKHIADQTTTLSWVVHLVLRGEAQGAAAGIRMVEAAAAAIGSRPVLSGEGWRADMTLTGDGVPVAGIAIGVRMRVSPA